MRREEKILKTAVRIGALCILIKFAQARALRAQENPTPTPTPTPTPALETTPSPDEKLEDLDQRVKIIERKREIEAEQAEEKRKTAPTFTAGREGFALRSADGAFVLRLRGYVQLDARIFDGSPAPDTFLMRRVRPLIEGTVFKIFDFRLMPDFGGGTTVLQDGYVEARFLPAVRLRAGKFKSPVGLERLQSATDLVFVERAMPTNLVPNRDVGAQVGGDLARGRVQYAVGFFNGVPDGGSGDSDNNDAKDIAARVFFLPFAGAGRGADSGVGVAFTTGDQTGTTSAPNLPTFRTAGQVGFFSYRSDTLASGRRTRIAPQATFYRGSLGVMAEYVQSKQSVRRGSDGTDVTNTAWQTTVSWVIRGTASYRGVTPKQDFSGLGTGPGAWEFAARYSELDVDDDAFPTFANPTSAARKARAAGVGVNWWANRNARFMLSGERTTFDGGAASGDRVKETVLLTRFQISF